MNQTISTQDRRDAVGVMKCKCCGGEVFSVVDLEDDTPIQCDQCGATVGRWADVRALTHIPEKGVLERTQADIFEPTYRGIAELTLVAVD